MAFKSMHIPSTSIELIIEPMEDIELDLAQQLNAYYQQLTPFEQRTCDIAREHLGSSFDLARSNGFIKYQSKLKPK